MCALVTTTSVIRTGKADVQCNGNALRLMAICGEHLLRAFLLL